MRRRPRPSLVIISSVGVSRSSTCWASVASRSCAAGRGRPGSSRACSGCRRGRCLERRSPIAMVTGLPFQSTPSGNWMKLRALRLHRTLALVGAVRDGNALAHHGGDRLLALEHRVDVRRLDRPDVDQRLTRDRGSLLRPRRRLRRAGSLSARAAYRRLTASDIDGLTVLDRVDDLRDGRVTEEHLERRRSACRARPLGPGRPALRGTTTMSASCGDRVDRRVLDGDAAASSVGRASVLASITLLPMPASHATTSLRYVRSVDALSSRQPTFPWAFVAADLLPRPWSASMSVMPLSVVGVPRRSRTGPR